MVSLSEWGLSSRFRGKSAIGGWNRLAFLCRHLTHLDLTFFKAFLNLIILHSCWIKLITYSLPSCIFHEALSSTELVQLDNLLSIILDAWRFSQDLKAADLSFEVFHPLLWRVTTWRCSIILRFICYLLWTSKHLGICSALFCFVDLICLTRSLLLCFGPKWIR